MAFVEYEIIVKTKFNWKDGFYNVTADRFTIPEEIEHTISKMLWYLKHSGLVTVSQFEWTGEEKGAI